MILIARKVLFFLDRHKSEEYGLLRCRIRWNHNRLVLTYNVGYRVTPSKWDQEAQRCLAKTYHSKYKTPAATINHEIDRFSSVIRSVFDNYERAEKMPTKEELRSDLSLALGQKSAKKEVKKAAPSQVSSLVEQFSAEMGTRNAWSPATFKAINNMKNHLQAYNPKLSINDFDEACLAGYVDFLRTDQVNEEGELLKAGLRNSTLTKQLGYLRWFLRWADTKGYLTARDYLTFKPRIKTAPARVVFLEWDELMAVYNLNFTEEDQRLEKVRDMFCFGCFTSLRYSDIVNLRWQDIRNNSINIVTQKTADPLCIELNSYARAIIAKYSEDEYPDNRVFPSVPNQVINRNLREVARLAGLDAPVHRTWYKGGTRMDETVPKWQLITSHCGRRTFICNALSLGIAPNIVMKWTGHSDYKAMKPYIEISRTATGEAMKRFEEKR